ncbi:MAG: hypothetical protein HQ500_12460 [Flavobacteriales bacterium]|nr:hypothetical protein [Flavobacteriales bacterium]
MNAKYQVIFVLFLFTATVACENTETHHHEHGSEAESAAMHSDSEAGLTLNDGQRWSANPETTEGINKMKERMNGFTYTEDQAAFQTLADSLEADFTMIFTKCTMKGEAHNQLHNFLLPMKEKFTNLGSGDANASKIAFEGLKRHLAGYKEYFE